MSVILYEEIQIQCGQCKRDLEGDKKALDLTIQFQKELIQVDKSLETMNEFWGLIIEEMEDGII